MTAENARGLSVKVDVDVSEAITGLKALQREAKEATKALKELEATVRGKYSLDELLADINEENRHAYAEEPVDYIRRSYE